MPRVSSPPSSVLSRITHSWSAAYRPSPTTRLAIRVVLKEPREEPSCAGSLTRRGDGAPRRRSWAPATSAVRRAGVCGLEIPRAPQSRGPSSSGCRGAFGDPVRCGPHPCVRRGKRGGGCACTGSRVNVCEGVRAGIGVGVNDEADLACEDINGEHAPFRW